MVGVLDRLPLKIKAIVQSKTLKHRSIKNLKNQSFNQALKKVNQLDQVSGFKAPRFSRIKDNKILHSSSKIKFLSRLAA